MFGLKRRSKNSRAEPVGVMITSGGEVIFPDGYVSLASSEEVRRCTHIIADTVSNMTLMLMKNGENGDERIKNELSKKLDSVGLTFDELQTHDKENIHLRNSSGNDIGR